MHFKSTEINFGFSGTNLVNLVCIYVQNIQNSAETLILIIDDLDFYIFLNF